MLTHGSRFQPQNFYNCISLNLLESEKNEKITSNDLTIYFLCFFTHVNIRISEYQNVGISFTLADCRTNVRSYKK